MYADNISALADNGRTVLTRGATNADIQKDLQKDYLLGVSLMKKSGAAKGFKGVNIEHTARNIWAFLKAKINYEVDPEGVQYLRTPPRFVKDGIGDCKSYSLFAASVLGALGLPVYIEYANYEKKGKPPFPPSTPTHVYVTTRDERGNRIIIDGVYNYFNQEKPYYFKKEVRMDTIRLSGTNDIPSKRQRNPGIYDFFEANQQYASQNPNHPMHPQQPVKPGRVTQTELNQYSGNQALQVRYKARVVESTIKSLLRSNKPEERVQGQYYLDMLNNGNNIAVGSFWSGFKKVTLSGARGAFLGLVKLNLRGLATKLSILGSKPAGKSQLEKKWKQLGGSYSALKKAFDVGAKRKPLLGAKNVHGIAEPVTLAILLTTAGAIIAAIAPLLKNIKLGNDKETDASLLLQDVSAAGGGFDMPGHDSITDEDFEKSPNNGQSKSFLGIDTNTLLLAGAAVAFVMVSKK